MNELLNQVLVYIRGIWSYRWLAMIVAWAICIFGWIGVYLLADEYQAEARFYVDTGSRLREVVQNLGMEPNVASRVFLVRQAMMGRPQLEKVARETDLDVQVSAEEEMDRLLNTLRENISITTGSRAEAQNLFRIGFVHEDREMAVRVVRSLLNSFYDDVLQQKDSDTQRTQSFLTEQLEYYRNLLENTEEKLQNFKKEHPGFVVGDRGDYFARMQTEQESLSELLTRKSIEESKRSELRRQLATVNPNAPVDGDIASSLVPGSETSQLMAELERNRRQLLLRVTELHPDVTALNEQIAQLRKQLQSELENASKSIGRDGAPSATNPVYIEMQIALSNSNQAIAGLIGEIEQLREYLGRLENEVDRAPELERVFVELTRDYKNYQGLYQEVLNQSERERIGRVGEEKDVISFNTIEPPRAGIEPVAPNRPLLITGLLLLGLGAGVGSALLVWLLKPTIHSASALAERIRLPVLGTIGINMQQAKHRHAHSLVLYGGVFSMLLGIFIVVILFESSGSQWLRDSIILVASR